MMAFWREAPETSQLIDRAEKTRAELLAFIDELNKFVSHVNAEIDDRENGEGEQ